MAASHNTPALIIVYGSEFLHLWFRGRRRLFLRFLPTEQSTLPGMGGPAELLGQSKRRQSSAALRDPAEVGMWIHTTGSIGQDDQIRSAKHHGPGIKSDTSLPRLSTGVFQAN